MRDFVSGFAAGFAGGVERGAALGLKARELRDDREAKAATLARQIASDEATATYHSGQLAIGERNAKTAEGRLGVSKSALTETGKHNRATENTASANAKTNRDRADAYITHVSGIDPGLQADLAAKGLGPTGGAVATPAVPTTPPAPEAAGGDNSITEEDQFISIFGPAGDTGEDPDKKE